MGASIWLIVIVPLMLFYGIFGNIYASIFGPAKTELALPYDEAKGIVWEYDDVNDYYIDLAETRIEGDKQIFVFENAGCDEEIIGRLMDVVFTDENGNQIKYYAESGDNLHGPEFFAGSECYSSEYTVTAEKPRKNCHWEVMQEKTSILCQLQTNDSETTFTIVMTPDGLEEGTDITETRLVPIFEYVNKRDDVKERVTTYFKVIDGVLTEYNPYG